jgi:hypothetical protein
MPPKKHTLPPPPDQPVTMLYEYKYNELPPDKKVVVDAMLRLYLKWVISNPKFWEDEEDAEIHKWFV